MTATNSLPLYFKRAAKIFLISVSSYFFCGFIQVDHPPDEIKNSIKTVVIDAGHGGKDSGAVGKQSKEKDLALKIALKLGALIEENVKDVKVIYTRKTDIFVELHERANIANRANADLFISIHVNSNTKTSPYGTSSHVLGLHRSDEHFNVAKTENSVILLEEDHETIYQGFDPTSIESYIIFSIMQNTYLKQSVEFASYVQTQFRERSKRKDRGVVQQGLLVLARTSMPAVLIETGFISNVTEEKFLMTDNGQELIASGIYRAFKEYKTRIENSSNFTFVESPEKEIEKTEEKVEVKKTEEESENKISFIVQIASSKNLVGTSPSSFKGHENVLVIHQGKWYKYAISDHWNYHEALNKCKEIKIDFPDAFVVAVQDNKIISLSEALLIINE